VTLDPATEPTTDSAADLALVGPALRATQAADIRPARPNELRACAQIWRDSINDYILPLGQPELPDDLTTVTALYEHLQATDPDRFVVAVREDDAVAGDDVGREANVGREAMLARARVVAFAAAVVRGSTWYLSMLFVLPEEQGLGLGRTLLERVLPPRGAGYALATTTDSAQPISNALYSSYGIVPRIPLLHLIGSVIRPGVLTDLPRGTVATPFEAIADRPLDDPRERSLRGLVADMDVELAGFDHPQEHAFLRRTGRRGFVYREAGGRPLGYGYTSEVGRVGPVAVRDADLLGPVLAHLLRVVQPRGAFAVWVPGSATAAVTTLLSAGLRLEGFPMLLCWSRPFGDFSRYLPISPGLL
jgi:GNAT superfamily N-acetyltransferase